MSHNKKLAMGIVSVVLASSMVLSIAGCTPDEGGTTLRPVPLPSGDYGYTWDYGDDEYLNGSASVYNNTFGEFYQYYTYAKAADKTLAERYALMAQAEAKLYETGTLLPTQANGGNYAVSKVANATVSSVAWGNDSDRLHYAIIATTPIKKSDRTAMKEYRNAPENAMQSGADYLAWMRTYLAGHGYETKEVYNMAYTSDPTTFDVLSTSEQPDAEPVVQTYDGLVEYDVKNKMQPAMAIEIPTAVAAEKAPNPTKTDDEGNPLEEDTVTFTFTIRSGQQWINSQGTKVADFKASDFATGFQHMLDAAGGLEYLVDGVVVGVDEYLAGTADFDDVQVKADDDAMTVTYQVYKSAESYFLTMLSYSVFAPLSKSFYEGKGGKFGGEYDPSADSYSYGKTYEDIAYCGPYYISQHIQENKMVFTANPTWWNKDTANARNTNTINWFFNNGEDDTKSYNDFKSGTIDGCGLAGANVVSAKAEKLAGDDVNIFDLYGYTSAMDSTAFCAFLNINRQAYSNFNDGAGASPKNDDAKENAYQALSNVHFRRALLTSVDREAYMAPVVGPDLAMTGISNMYTPGTFVSLPEAVTLQIGNENKTFAAGTMYGEIVQAQLDADGMAITVWKEVDGEYTYTGFNGWYNTEYAKSELALAVSELAALGLTVDADHPIELDYPYLSASTYYSARANTLKQGMESVLEGKVKINLVPMNQLQWQYAGFYADEGRDANYDIYDLSGWGPDYGDPQTYLDTMLPDYNGYMAKCFGIF